MDDIEKSNWLTPDRMPQWPFLELHSQLKTSCKINISLSEKSWTWRDQMERAMWMDIRSVDREHCRSHLKFFTLRLVLVVTAAVVRRLWYQSGNLGFVGHLERRLPCKYNDINNTDLKSSDYHIMNIRLHFSVNNDVSWITESQSGVFRVPGNLKLKRIVIIFTRLTIVSYHKSFNCQI